jgi:hypothetical protein
MGCPPRLGSQASRETWLSRDRRLGRFRKASQLPTPRRRPAHDSGHTAGHSNGQNVSPADTGSVDCDANYEGGCVPTRSGTSTAATFETHFDVVEVDMDGVDGDGDGIACESY